MATDPVFIITPIEPEEGTIALAPDTGETETEAIMASDSAPGAGASKMGALPLAAQLPFLLFRN